MLAKTLKSAAELGLADHEYNALCRTLYMMEDEQIKPDLIYMRNYTEYTSCGTAHCLAGWAHEIDKNAFPECNGNQISTSSALSNRLPLQLSKLFGINHSKMAGATPTVAIATLRAYLETGICPV